MVRQYRGRSSAWADGSNLIFRHGSMFQSYIQKFFNFVASTRPIRVRDWISDIQQITFHARHTRLAFDSPIYYMWTDGNQYEYTQSMHEAFLKLMTRLKGYKRRGILWVGSDVVNDIFAEA